MKLHPGLVIRVNKAVVAAVSSENLNILSVRICGDVLSPEVGVLEVTGGYYGGPEETTHFLWVDSHEISGLDEIEIQLQDIPASSHAGKTIEELWPEEDTPADDQPFDIEELARDLQGQPRLRNGFDLHMQVSGAAPQIFSMREPDYAFFISIMWHWRSTDSASLGVYSNTIEDIGSQNPGTTYLQQRYGLGQSVQVRISSR